jgi:hypothetical protein
MRMIIRQGQKGAVERGRDGETEEEGRVTRHDVSAIKQVCWEAVQATDVHAGRIRGAGCRVAYAGRLSDGVPGVWTPSRAWPRVCK